MEQELVSQLLMRVAELQATVESQKPSLWVTLGPSAITGLVGFLAAMVPTAWLERRRVRHQTRVPHSSLIAEISGLADIIRERNYLESLREGAEGQIQSLSVNVPEDYFRVFRANTDKLGLLEPQDAFRIVRLYQLLESVIHDVIPDGVLYTGNGSPEAFQQDLTFLETALELADELIAEHSIKR